MKSHGAKGHRLFQALLSLAWLAIVITMVHAFDAHPPDGDEGHGANVEGALTFGVIASGVELLLFSLITRPWFQRRSGGALFLAWGVLLPWMTLSILMSLHGGNVLMLHVLWLALLLVALLTLTLAHLGVRFRARPNKDP